eukprot:361456-Chlamydomonas_euryale.AAC.5
MVCAMCGFGAEILSVRARKLPADLNLTLSGYVRRVADAQDQSQARPAAQCCGLKSCRQRQNFRVFHAAIWMHTSEGMVGVVLSIGALPLNGALRPPVKPLSTLGECPTDSAPHMWPPWETSCKWTSSRGPDSQPHPGAGLDPQGTTEHLRASHTKGLGLTLRGPQST